MLLWGAVIFELSKSPEKQNNRKIVTLTSLGSLSTFIITISLFQKFPFKNLISSKGASLQERDWPFVMEGQDSVING